ncbi:hypothetical protein BV22DRAFT_441093 [Leucogyrophana mollusca]|uniref:Uncharacterized protein n=1 Tax=Leucogyrophana mollusca TaxID=85980 RepID=A0ACB8BJF5_9AGAM|nr:hypothetical protein BV22DRAFT_441093 [Leucogyrophana mollusca]
MFASSQSLGEPTRETADWKFPSESPRRDKVESIDSGMIIVNGILAVPHVCYAIVWFKYQSQHSPCGTTGSERSEQRITRSEQPPRYPLLIGCHTGIPRTRVHRYPSSIKGLSFTPSRNLQHGARKPRVSRYILGHTQSPGTQYLPQSLEKLSSSSLSHSRPSTSHLLLSRTHRKKSKCWHRREKILIMSATAICFKLPFLNSLGKKRDRHRPVQ